MCFVVCVFFFKQKTAYEMRISDWSSDVCSSDLGLGASRGSGQSSISSLPLQLQRRFHLLPGAAGEAMDIYAFALARVVHDFERGRAVLVGGTAGHAVLPVPAPAKLANDLLRRRHAGAAYTNCEIGRAHV